MLFGWVLCVNVWVLCTDVRPPPYNFLLINLIDFYFISFVWWIGWINIDKNLFRKWDSKVCAGQCIQINFKKNISNRLIITHCVQRNKNTYQMMEFFETFSESILQSHLLKQYSNVCQKLICMRGNSHGCRDYGG